MYVYIYILYIYTHINYFLFFYNRTKGIDTRAGRKKEGERKKSTGTSQSPTTDAVGDT